LLLLAYLKLAVSPQNLQCRVYFSLSTFVHVPLCPVGFMKDRRKRTNIQLYSIIYFPRTCKKESQYTWLRQPRLTILLKLHSLQHDSTFREDKCSSSVGICHTKTVFQNNSQEGRWHKVPENIYILCYIITFGLLWEYGNRK
jgi:hypothetical protein